MKELADLSIVSDEITSMLSVQIAVEAPPNLCTSSHPLHAADTIAESVMGDIQLAILHKTELRAHT